MIVLALWDWFHGFHHATSGQRRRSVRLVLRPRERPADIQQVRIGIDEKTTALGFFPLLGSHPAALFGVAGASSVDRCVAELLLYRIWAC
jgi:hypothetical protein